MSRTMQIRLERLEEAHLQSATPHRVLSSCPLPDEPASQATIVEWLDEGLARVAFGGRAVFYDGGQHGVLGLDEWRAAYCHGATNSAVGASDGAAHRERGTQRGSIEDLP
jgi:hypothetical protein